jgi:multiple sugar transport system permease protein
MDIPMWKLKQSSLFSFLFVLPAIVYLLFVYGYPLTETFRLSLYEGNLALPFDTYEFVGLANFLKLLNASFGAVLWHTAVFTGLSVLLSLLIGMIGALLLSESFGGRFIFRTLVILPWVIPNALVGIIWRWLYHTLGPINSVLVGLELIEKPIDFVSGDFSLLWVSVARAWKATPFVVLCLMASLQAIDESLYESARIDGASAFQRFRYITLPQISSVFLTVLVLLTIWTANNFGIVFTIPMGGGYALSKIETLAVAIYRTVISDFNIGLGCAMAVFGVLILAIPTYIYFKMTRS